MANLEQEIYDLIRKAGLTEEETRIVEKEIVGQKLTNQLVWHTSTLIKRILMSRDSNDLNSEWYQKLLNERLDQDRVQRELTGDWVSNISRPLIDKKAVDAKIAPSDAYHHSHSQQQCPHCYSTSNISSLGEIIVDGGSRPALLCGNCNRVFSDLPDGVKILLDAAVKEGAESVGFRAVSTDLNSPTPVYNNYETQETNRKLDQVNSNLDNMVNTIQNLMYQVQELAEQNNKMMEQLANDPLIHMRKTITEFNLK